MKALRYLLVAIVVMLAVQSVSAQEYTRINSVAGCTTFGQTLTTQSVSAQEYTRINSVAGCTTFGQTERQYQFHSTSAILAADLNFGLAEGGAFTEGINTGNPVVTLSGPRRDVGGGSGVEDEKEPEAPGEPFPIGDGAWAMLVMAAGYLIYRVRTRRRVVMA